MYMYIVYTNTFIFRIQYEYNTKYGTNMMKLPKYTAHMEGICAGITYFFFMRKLRYGEKYIFSVTYDRSQLFPVTQSSSRYTLKISLHSDTFRNKHTQFDGARFLVPVPSRYRSPDATGRGTHTCHPFHRGHVGQYNLENICPISRKIGAHRENIPVVHPCTCKVCICTSTVGILS